MELHPEVVKRLCEYGVGARHPDDPLFGGKPPPRLGVYDVDEESLCHKAVRAWCGVPGCQFASETLVEQTRHYESAHRYTCAECKRVLPSPHLLHLHLQETHDSFFAVCAARKPAFSCYTEQCTEKFWNADERLAHCVKVHKLPKDFRLEKSGKKPHKKSKQEQMELSNDDLNQTGALHTDRVAVPKNFSFGHGKTKSFASRAFSKFTNSEKQKKEQHVDMDVIVNELKDSLPSH